MEKSPMLQKIIRLRPYWESASVDPLATLSDIVQAEDLVWDPFCGSGLPVLKAALGGARVIAGDLNPVAVLLTRTLLQPMGLFALKQAFAAVQERVSEKGDRPPRAEIAVDESAVLLDDPFTRRNRDALARLSTFIDQLPGSAIRDGLRSVFISMLFDCAAIDVGQRQPDWFPASVRTAKTVQEWNVWQVFCRYFDGFLRLKQWTNQCLSHLRLTDSIEIVVAGKADVCLMQTDIQKLLIPSQIGITHVIWHPPGEKRGAALQAAAFQSAWLTADIDTDRYWPGPDDPSRMKSEQGLLKQLKSAAAPGCRVACLSREAVSVYPLADCRDTIRIPPARLSDTPGRGSRKTLEQYALYIRAAAHVGQAGSGIRSLAAIRNVTGISRPDLAGFTADPETNQKAYHGYCLALLAAVLQKDGYRLVSLARERFDLAQLTEPAFLRRLADCGKAPGDIDIVAENKDGRQISFCFFDPLKQALYRKIANRMAGKSDFRRICYLIVTDPGTMDTLRTAKWSENWPRGFFVCFTELLSLAAKISVKGVKPFQQFLPDQKPHVRNKGVRHFKGEVLENLPIGDPEKPQHYKLVFQTQDMHSIGPGQFIMVDPLSDRQRKQTGRHGYPVLRSGVSSGKQRKADLTPQPFLKRPFGVQRAYYPHFEWGYHHQLSLPPHLAGITHSVYPNRFEVLYKVIAGGIGTNAMVTLQKGDTIRILGPLGKYTHIPEWRLQGIREVHLIGGGVGMAPLVFFGQALKFYAFTVKAFIGIDRVETLLQVPYGRSFADDAEKAYVYIDELDRIGLQPRDIHLAREVAEKRRPGCDKIGKQNHYHGFVTDQYAAYLEKRKNRQGILILTCGPAPMMTALKRIADAHSIPMKVLLEKRMGCGIGVCMSCVCRTRQGDTGRYARVCVEGPVFDSNEIDWDNL